MFERANFISSYTSPSSIDLEPFPAVAFIGRSNTGKSSFINRILKAGNISKVGKTPGKTQLINFFEVDGKYHFVDLPGYGFASMPIAEKKRMLAMVRDFLTNYTPLVLTVQLFDIRRVPSDEDLEYFDLLSSRCSVFIIANKEDKISKNELRNSLRKISSRLEVEVEPTPFSCLKPRNADYIRQTIYDQLEENRTNQTR